MSLSTVVQARVAAQLLRELTNHGDSAATSINTTRLDAACADAVGLFGQRVGVAFDETVAAHLPAAVACVVWLLHVYTGEGGASLEEAQKRWEELGNYLSRTLGSRRPAPAETSSAYAPTREREGERPTTDPSNWGAYVIGKTGSGSLFDQPEE